MTGLWSGYEVSVSKTSEMRTLWTWKCPKCPKKGKALFQKTAEYNLAQHLLRHENLETKAQHWAGSVEATLEGVK